jgi:acetyl esterase/lipase
MDISLTGLVRLLLPRVPLLLKTALLNALSLSPNSSKQDLQTELTVIIIRSIITIRRPMTYLQHISRKDPAIKGPVSIAKVTILAPSEVNGPRDAIVQAIKALGDGTETYTLPAIDAVNAEWTGYRKGVPKNEPRPDVPEEDQYRILMSTVASKTTILYFHGGAYFLMSSASHRDPVSRLAKLTGGRGFSVDYRLAPQNPFPAQLLDGLIAYLYLLAPPPGSLHEKVSAKHIVFAGDSAGANLCVAMLQLLLTLQRIGVKTIKFHGVEVPVELPAGIAPNSCWADICRSLPSINANASLDYLDPPSASGIAKTDPIPDDLWPTKPPRAEIFCNASMMTHPLASPLAAKPEDWRGMPPAWFCLGNEGLEDEITVLARRMHAGGGSVAFVGYEGMPHCFAMVFPTTAKGKDCFERQGKFITDVTTGKAPTSSQAVWIKAFSNPLAATPWKFEDLSKLSDEDVAEAMRRMQTHARSREEEALKKWNEQQSKAKL